MTLFNELTIASSDICDYFFNILFSCKIYRRIISSEHSSFIRGQFVFLSIFPLQAPFHQSHKHFVKGLQLTVIKAAPQIEEPYMLLLLGSEVLVSDFIYCLLRPSIFGSFLHWVAGQLKHNMFLSYA